MTWTPWKSFDEHLDYMRRMVGLNLWFIGVWQHRRPAEAFEDILRKRTLIYRYCEVHTDFFERPRNLFDDPRWLSIERGLGELYERCRAAADEVEFERKGLELLGETIRKRTVVDYEEEPQFRREYQFGSLKYNVPETPKVERIVFHIANALAPKSMLDDPAHLPHCFLGMMAETRAKYGARELSTNSWINSVKRWQELFPQEYVQNMGPPDEEVEGHTGFWGQFIDSRGLFSERRAEQFRRAGKFPYALRFSWCTFDAMEKHLCELLERFT